MGKFEGNSLVGKKVILFWELNQIWGSALYCKTHYYRAPFNFTYFALGDDNAYITGADMRSK